MAVSEEPLAYFLTWVTYGTWLPGDERGWTDYQRGWKLPDSKLAEECKLRMSEDAVVLNATQREAVERQIRETCRHNNWTLHAVNCRSNHVHVVVSGRASTKRLRATLKAYATRCLKTLSFSQPNSENMESVNTGFESATSKSPSKADGVTDQSNRERWWADRGSIHWIYSEESLFTVIEYVLEGQDGKRVRSRKPR